MANELAIIEKNWLTLADHIKEVPAPFEQTILLAECSLAGTIEIEDVLVKTQNVDTGTELVLKRSAAEVQDERAVAVQTKGDVLLGYVPRRYSAVMARLMDAVKNLSAKVVGKELDGHWLDVKISIDMKEV